MTNGLKRTNRGSTPRTILPPGVNLAALRSGSPSSGAVGSLGRSLLSRILITLVWRVVSWLLTRALLLGGIAGAVWWYWGSGLTSLPSLPFDLSNFLDSESWTDWLRKLRDWNS